MIVAGVVGGVVGSALVQGYFARSKSERLDKALVEAASELNKNLPMHVDSETRLDTTMAGPGRSFFYRYTLVNLRKSETDPAEIERKLRPRILAQYRTSDAMKSFRDGKVTMHYHYSDKDGTFLTEIVVKPDDTK